MARAYSLDLRERVVAAVAAGQSCRSVAKTFMVSVASVVKWSQRQRAVGSPAALRMGGRSLLSGNLNNNLLSLMVIYYYFTVCGTVRTSNIQCPGKTSNLNIGIIYI